jgi:hypothetical protein
MTTLQVAPGEKLECNAEPGGEFQIGTPFNINLKFRNGYNFPITITKVRAIHNVIFEDVKPLEEQMVLQPNNIITRSMIFETRRKYRWRYTVRSGERKIYFNISYNITNLEFTDSIEVLVPLRTHWSVLGVGATFGATLGWLIQLGIAWISNSPNFPKSFGYGVVSFIISIAAALIALIFVPHSSSPAQDRSISISDFLGAFLFGAVVGFAGHSAAAQLLTGAAGQIPGLQSTPTSAPTAIPTILPTVTITS